MTDQSFKSGNCKVASFESTPSLNKEIGIGEYSLGGSSIAQAFVVSGGVDSNTKTASPASVSVSLIRKGSFNPNMHTLTATIEGNGSFGPDSKSLASSDPVDVSTISESGSITSFKFKTKPTLNQSTVYWIRIKASYSLSDTNYIAWQNFEGKSGGYTYGDTALNAVYEQSDPNHFATSLIGIYRFMIFRISC